jgi:glycosyltransferase involved in cell wall biosynthesis
MGDYERAITYILDNNIEGVCVECGVERADVEVMWINELQKHKQVRDIYLFDTFSGLTPPDERDYGLLNGWSAQDVKNCWSQHHINDNTNGWCYCPLTEVKERLLNTGYPEDKLHFVVGDVKDTLENVNNLPEKIAILRLDTDWYESTKIELEKLYDRVTPGGLIIIDDYYYWAGQQKAVDEFFINRGVKYDVVQTSSKTGYIVKHPRVAIWIEDNWAFGRIARALHKYAKVDVYDWRDGNATSKLWNETWKNYDYIISTSLVLTMDFVPREAFKKIVTLVMHGEFGDPYFCEIDKVQEDVHYGAICKSVVEDMKQKGYPNPRWVPWGVDTDLFQIKYSVTGPIRKIGLIASDPSHNTQYSYNKGYSMFQEICDAVGAEAVYIRGKPEGQIYDDIDLLICCSRVEGGPFGIFEASASGLPVMSTPVGNMKDIDGLVLFTTVDEAVQQLNKWNDDITRLQEYTESITREVRTNWSMKVCVDRFMSSFT